MKRRVWLACELIAAVLYAIPAMFLIRAGAQHVAHWGQSPILYVLGTSWYWGPAVVLATAVVLQSRRENTRLGWYLSLIGAVPILLQSLLALVSFSRQGDVHWVLWAMFGAAAPASIGAFVAVLALRPPDHPAAGGADRPQA